jgi:hypothetical protein
MASAAAGGGEDGNGGGNRDSSHHKGKNTNAAPDQKKMGTFERCMLQYMKGKTVDAVARGEEPPWDGIYTPKEMHHFLQRKTANAIARGEEPPYGGLYATPPDPSVANPPTIKPTESKPSSSRRRNG